jgi:MerR family transcriptional regulator, thiopeptide resistance regulator
VLAGDVDDRASTTGGLSVGELARLAGVSARTVRHYHAIGLLPEPKRDSMGYRRYDSQDAIALVRAARLRALGMSLPQVATRLAQSSDGGGSASDSLRALADELDQEINRLAATRDRLYELAASETFDQPVKALTRALRESGLIGPNDELGTGHEWAAALLDAVHPHGMSGVLTQASGLMNDPKVAAEFVTLLEQARRLGPGVSDARVDALADKVAAILSRFVDGASLADAELLGKVFADRLNPAQRRFLYHLRTQIGPAS